MSSTLNEDFPLTASQIGLVKTKPKGVYKKLMEARIRLQNTKLTKSGLNKFAGYQYFELGDFLPVIQEIFHDLGLCGLISYGREEAWLTITDTDDGSSIAVQSPMSEANLKGCHPVQNLGAVQTYTRRYLWVTAMEIVEHDALDATTGKGKPESFKSEPKAAWDELDKDTQDWMVNEAMAISIMIADSDIEGAFKHIEKLELEEDYRIAFESRLDSQQRALIKNYSRIINCKELSELAILWESVPKYAKPILEEVKNKRKTELN